MHPIVLHIANGHSFMSGAVLIVGCILLRMKQRSKWLSRVTTIVIILGLLLAVLSATPLNLLVWCILFCGSLCLFRKDLCERKWLALTVCISWTTVAIIEATWHITPTLPPELVRLNLPVVVLADSVTAGLGEGEAITWPQLLRDQIRSEVIDLSHVGETTASALKRAQQNVLPDEAVFILELGGNDILGATSAAQFEDTLDSLLTYLNSRDHHLFMFELPLIPFHNNWGRIQRRLAEKHGISLIPKWQLASVFAGPTSTLDSIHLSQEGHERILKIVLSVLQPKQWDSPSMPQ